MGRRLLSRRDILRFIAMAILLAAAIAGLSVHLESAARESLMREVKLHLRAVATLASKTVSADDIVSIRTATDRSSPAFERVFRAFRTVRDEVYEIKDIYALRPTERPRVWMFVVDSQPDDEDANNDGIIQPEERGAPPGLEYEEPEGADFRAALVSATTDQDFTFDQWGVSLSGYAPICDANGRPVAIVGVDMDQKSIIDKMDTMRLAIFLGTALIGVLLAGAFYLYVRQSLAYRRAVMLQDQLESIKTHLAKFVPEHVLRLIEVDPEAPALEKVERDVSVAFVDLAGYTRLSEIIPGKRLNHLVEHYLSEFLDCIHAAGGDVTETAGDGFMAIFMAADPRSHARAAVGAARDILRRTEELNVGRDEPINVHIGISSGPAFVGATKMHGVSGDRWTFTATGPVTNLAARIGSGAQPGEVLVSRSTADRVFDAFPFVPLGTRSFKNVSEPVEVFRLELGNAGHLSSPDQSGQEEDR